MPKVSTLQKVGADLFVDLDTLTLTEYERSQVLRYRFLLTRRLEKPDISNKTLVEELSVSFDISKAQAYRDISEAEQIFGKITNITKAWARYTFTEKIKEAMSLAQDAGDYEALIKALAVFGKFHRLDKEDPDPLPYDEIVPPVIEYINDPALMGVKVDNPEAMVKKIKDKYITNVEFTEVKN